MFTENMLAHIQRPLNQGLLKEANTKTAGRNGCGDTLGLTLLIVDGVVEKVGWVHKGCALSLCTTSILSNKVHLLRTDDARILIRRFLLGQIPSDSELLDLRHAIDGSPGRMGCIVEVFRIFLDALS